MLLFLVILLVLNRVDDNNGIMGEEEKAILETDFFKNCLTKMRLNVVFWFIMSWVYLYVAYVGYLNNIRILAFFGAGHFWILLYVTIKLHIIHKMKHHPGKLQEYWRKHWKWYVLGVACNIFSPVVATASILLFIVALLFAVGASMWEFYVINWWNYK